MVKRKGNLRSINDCVFNKSICLANIRILARISGIKIGELEKYAGSCPGYLSRIEHSNLDTLPHINFLAAAVKKLNTNWDTICTCDLSQFDTDDEIQLLKFYEKLRIDTLTNKITWCNEDLIKVGNISKLTKLIETISQCYSIPLRNGKILYMVADNLNTKKLVSYDPINNHTELLSLMHGSNTLDTVLSKLYDTIIMQIEENNTKLSNSAMSIINEYMEEE